ncbi:MAG: hypothetical protein ABFQ62_00220 [Patescibacteria group bacterium]
MAKVDIFREELTEQIPDSESGPPIAETDTKKLFLKMFNSGGLLPIGIKVDTPRAQQEMAKFEKTVMVLDGKNEEGMLEALRSLYKRFPKLAEELGLQCSNDLINIAQELGINVKQDAEEDWLQALKSHGSAVYFPTGVIGEKIVFEKMRYFSPEIERVILHASEWRLASESERAMADNSHLISIGLSVGSELAHAALLKGITSFTLADPGILHADLKGRLGLGYDERWLGANKAAFVALQILRLYPYAIIDLFPDGIIPSNVSQVMNPHNLTAEMISGEGRLLVAEEADAWDAKKSPREQLHTVIKDIVPWLLVTLGDVENRVVGVVEDVSTLPFQGWMEQFGDPFGDQLVQNKGELAGLLAVVGGFESIPLRLLQLLADGEIGGGPNAEISRVPQSREATLLASAIFLGILRIVGNGGEVNGFFNLDVDATIDAHRMNDAAKNRQAIKTLRKKMNQEVFGKPSITG